jgi:putative spermidine/putrescine transport system substrate-binding protein
VDAKHVEWDVIEGGTPWYPAFVKQDLVQQIDLKKLDTSDLIPRAALPYGVAPLVTSMAMAYNTKKFPNEHPNTWMDFWDVKKFEGPRSFPAEFSYVTEFALLADGVPADKLYPIDLDRAFRKLNELKPSIKVFWKQADQPIQLLSQGEVVASPAFNGRVIAAQESGFPLTLTYNQAAYVYSYLYIVKGAPHPDEAHEYLKFICKAKPQAAVAMEIPYGPTNKKAMDMIPAARQKLLPTYSENLKNMWALNGEWLGEHFDELNNRYQKFMLG